MSIKKQSRRTKCDIVTENVLNLIIEKPYAPGDLLPSEPEFCSLFKVSRVTIRESLKRLSNMGVLNIRQGEGTFVNEITIALLLKQISPLLKLSTDSMDAVFDTRICIESEIAKLAAKNRTKNDLVLLKKQLSKMSTALEEKDITTFSLEDTTFHTQIALASKNEILLGIFYMLHTVRQESIYLSNLTSKTLLRSYQKHEELYEAIANQDTENISAIMRLHLQDSKRAILRLE
jgi:Transcriptional regulators